MIQTKSEYEDLVIKLLNLIISGQIPSKELFPECTEKDFLEILYQSRIQSRKNAIQSMQCLIDFYLVVIRNYKLVLSAPIQRIHHRTAWKALK